MVDLNKLNFNYFQTPEFEQLRSYFTNVQIRTDLESKLLNIKGPPVHQGKTIMNITYNALEAINGYGEV